MCLFRRSCAGFQIELAQIDGLALQTVGFPEVRMFIPAMVGERGPEMFFSSRSGHDEAATPKFMQSRQEDE